MKKNKRNRVTIFPESRVAINGPTSIFKMLDYLDTDDKVGNGFLVVLQKNKHDTARTIGQARSCFAYDSVNFR
jgi:hypothetical protein